MAKILSQSGENIRCFSVLESNGVYPESWTVKLNRIFIGLFLTSPQQKTLCSQPSHIARRAQRLPFPSEIPPLTAFATELWSPVRKQKENVCGMKRGGVMRLPLPSPMYIVHCTLYIFTPSPPKKRTPRPAYLTLAHGITAPI